MRTGLAIEAVESNPLRGRGRATLRAACFVVAALGLAAVLTAAALLAGRVPASALAENGDPVVAVAGDIACDPASGSFNGGLGTATACRQKATSDLLVGRGLAAVLTTGDNQYECGGGLAYTQSYDLSWGRLKSITRPAIGNHEHFTSGGTDCDPTGSAAGHYGYFGAAAGDPSKGYYSYDIGAWHLIALNSNCSQVGGCGAGSPQEQWLRQDLAASTAKCTLAYWHFPLFTSGNYRPGISATRPLYQALYDHGAEVVLTGHDHNYERFAPQRPDGTADPVRGIRHFVVGTGGKSHYPQGTPVANSERQNGDTFGVLLLTLHPTSYDWQFVPETGATFTDSGNEGCDRAPPSGGSVTVGANADSRVEEANPSSNFGTSNLRVDGAADPDVNSHLRFTVSGVPAPVQQATLRLFASSGTVDGPAISPTGSDWTESGVTWANRPPTTGGPGEDRGAITSGSWVEWDVTPYVTGNGTYSFVLKGTSSDGVDFNSREASASRPELVVTYGFPGYARPAGATVLRVPLVPAFERCLAPTSIHGPSLSYPSCSPPANESDIVTTTGRGTGSVRLNVITGDLSTPSDEADVGIAASATDVRTVAGLDYTGRLVLAMDLRITDRASGAAESDPATMEDIRLSAPLDCVPDVALDVGSACALETSADTLLPGTAREGKRAILESFQFRLDDPGPDGSLAPPPGGDPLGAGCPPTCGSGDERPFLRQGIFVP